MAENELRYRGKVPRTKETNDKEEFPPRRSEPENNLEHSFWLTRIVFLRGLSLIYFVAFLVSFNQNKELIGDNGLLPTKLYLEQVKKSAHNAGNLELFLKVPTLFWWIESSWNQLDFYLDLTALTGMILSSIVFIKGSGNAVIMSILWILYHSIVNIGQRWFSFGWESQLLETGFVAIWIVPIFSLDQFKCKPNWFPVLAYRWLITRIMLGAGLIKIRGDKCWTDLTCMNYFFETQPNPNPISYFAHPAPEAWHKFETFGNHVVELVFPFLSFVPSRKAAMVNGFFQILFQVILISTGNLSFLNWLTIMPSIWFFDDQTWSKLFSEDSSSKLKDVECSRNNSHSTWSQFSSKIRFLTSIVIGGILAYLSIPIVQNLLSTRQIMNTSFEPFRIVNTYGAFGSVTKERTEVVFEGTQSSDPNDPKAVWLEYDFKRKPGSLNQRPCLISPYHYRLDWLMWFAAFQSYQHNPWMLHLALKMLRNDPIVDSLILNNPFRNSTSPNFVRAKHYKYNFSKIGSKAAKKGQWWTRTYIKDYLPILNSESLKPICDQFGWQ